MRYFIWYPFCLASRAWVIYNIVTLIRVKHTDSESIAKIQFAMWILAEKLNFNQMVSSFPSFTMKKKKIKNKINEYNGFVIVSDMLCKVCRLSVNWMVWPQSFEMFKIDISIAASSIYFFFHFVWIFFPSPWPALLWLIILTMKFQSYRMISPFFSLNYFSSPILYLNELALLSLAKSTRLFCLDTRRKIGKEKEKSFHSINHCQNIGQSANEIQYQMENVFLWM